MARRRGVPTVGAQQLHPVQISPEIRALEARRARAAAHRTYAPKLAADRGAFDAANKTYQGQAASDRGATNAVEGTLVNALAGLKDSGLSGRYLQQTKRALLTQQGAVAAGLPFLLAGAKEDRGTALTAARQELAQDRAGMQSSAASAFNQRLKELRGEGSTAVAAEQKKAAEEREDAKTGGRSKEELESLSNAQIAFKNALSNWAKNPKVEVDGEEVHAREAFPLQSADDWRHFAEEMVHHSEGFGLTDAMTVIHHFLQNKKQKMHQGKLPQPGIPFSVG